MNIILTDTKRVSQQKRGPLKLWIALNSKRVELKNWNFTNLFIESAKQVGEVSAFELYMLWF